MITAHFPPFDTSPSVCKCGWMWATDCDMTSEKCGMKQGMPEYKGHTPYEFLSEWTPQEDNPINLDAICREVVEDAIRDKQVGGSHYAEMEVQPWDAMRAWMSPEEYAGYQVGTCISYLARHKKKGGLQDLKKAHHHLSELLRYFEEDEEYPW